MEASLEPVVIGGFSAARDSTRADAAIAEEVRVFRAEIARWARGYVERRDVTESEDESRKASANLRGWSHDYFRATYDMTEAPGQS